MQIKAQISFQYHGSKEAQIALKSLYPDNMGFVDSHVSGSKLVFNLNGDSLSTFLATVDDLLFCEMMVERVLELEK